MRREMFLYPNLSKGGVSAVLRGRALAAPTTRFDAVFLNDRGGKGAYSDLPNVDVRVVSRKRIDSYLQYLSNTFFYEDATVLSHPAAANCLSGDERMSVTYEFHSSAMDIIQKEIEELEVDRLALISAPSQVMVDSIRPLLPRRVRNRLTVRPNLISHSVFDPEGPADFFDYAPIPASVPLVWVGRLDAGKAPAHFVRMMARLPEKFTGHLVLSLENDPSRVASFLGECSALGVSDRIKIYSNLSPARLASLFRAARDRHGWLVSTSLHESFGYAVAEALECQLRVVASDLPVWDIFEGRGHLERVPSGSVRALEEAILRQAR